MVTASYSLVSFRTLATIELLIAVGTFFIPLGNPIPPSLYVHVKAIYNTGSLLKANNPEMLATFALGSLIADVGLLFLQNWARHLFAGLAVAGLVITYFTGYSVSSPVQRIVLGISVYGDGAILCMAYLSEFSERFR